MALLPANSIAYIDERERILDCMEKINGASKLLLSLINEVLDMSKIESGRLILSEELLDLRLKVSL